MSQDDGLQTVNDGASGRSGQGGSANGLQADIEELKRVMEQLQEGGDVEDKESMVVWKVISISGNLLCVGLRRLLPV
jgi:hypothetical protein